MKEKPIAVFRPSLLGLLGTPFVRVAVAVFSVAMVERYLDRNVPDETVAFLARLWVVLVACMAAFEVLVALVRRSTTSLAVYHDRLILSRGVLNRRTSKAWTREIVGMDVSRSLAGRILGYGNVVIETRGTDTIVAWRFADATGIGDVIDSTRSEQPGIGRA